MEIEIYKIDKELLDELNLTIKDTEKISSLKNLKEQLFLKKRNFVLQLQRIGLSNEEINKILENSIIKEPIEFYLKKAELEKITQETQNLGKNSKLEFYIKVISIVSGMVLALLGGYTGLVNYNEKIEIKKQKEKEIETLMDDISENKQIIAAQKEEINDIQSQKDSIQFIIDSKKIKVNEQDKRIIENDLQLDRLKKQLAKKSEEFNLLEKNYNVRKNELLLVSKALSESKTSNKDANKKAPEIEIKSRRWDIKKRSYWLGISLSINGIDEDLIKSVSYTFPEGMGFNDVDNVNYKTEYKLKVSRDFEIVIVVVLKNGEVFTKTKKFLFNEE